MATTESTPTTAISIQLPTHTLAGLRESFGDDLSRAALEAFVAEGYRTGKLGIGQVCEFLGFDLREDSEKWLGERNIPSNYGLEEFKTDLATIDRLFPPVAR